MPILIYHCVLTVKVVVANFNKEKALEGAISVILKLQTSRRFVSSSPPYPIVLLGGGRQQERGPALAQMTHVLFHCSLLLIIRFILYVLMHPMKMQQGACWLHA